ncbi:hypothetical protein OH77DRAFT_1523246, partial [Trametes cingulata]
CVICGSFPFETAERPLDPNPARWTYASKWVRGKERVSFDHIYDGVDRELRGWNPSSKIPAERLQRSDIVLVECYVKRFKNKSLNTNDKEWTAWGVQFELLRIAQLFIGPGVVDEEPPDSLAVF